MPRAFTLFEVLVALGLILLLTGGLYSFLGAMGSRQALLSASVDDAYAGCAILERIEGDALAALAGGGSMGSGIVGTASDLKLLSRGVWLGDDGDGDLQGCEFIFDRAASSVRARRWAGASPSGEFEVVSTHVREMRLRYFDGRRWVESFDSGSAGYLPVAIEVSIWAGLASIEEPTEPEPILSDPEDASGFDPFGGPEEAMPLWDEEPMAGEGEPIQTPPDRVRVIAIPDGGREVGP